MPHIDNDSGEKLLSFEEMPAEAGSMVTKKGVVQVSNFGQSNVYHLESTIKFEPHHTLREESTTGTIRPVLALSMQFRRDPSAHLFNIALPLFLINLISLGAFAVAPDEPADRLSISLTMVLTSVAFKLQISASLPPISYLTLLDWFVLTSFIFVSCIAGENIIAASRLGSFSNEVDAAFGWAFLALLVTIAAIFALIGLSANHRATHVRLSAIEPGRQSDGMAIASSTKPQHAGDI